MANFLLPYGREELELTIHDERLAGVLQSKVLEYEVKESEEDLVKAALRSPIDSKPLRELVKGKKKIVILSSDHTRPVPSRITMPLLLEEIRSGNPEASITILIATGFHRPTTKAEMRERYGATIVEEEEIHVHDSREDEMVDLGTLPSGGRLLLNALALEADFLLAEGFIEPHFFAGFSGGRKSVLPGIASRKTVLANHCAEFISHPSARTGILEDNPIHRDMIFAAKKAGLGFILNVVINAKHQVIHAFAGHPDRAHLKGCAFVEELAGADAIPAPIVITTNGGYPLDQDIYQAVKGMSAAEATCEEGGVIIALSSCTEGHGGEDFYKTFAEASSPLEIMNEILRRDQRSTVPDQWESQILSRILLKYKVIMVTEAPREMVLNMKMQWAPSMEAALQMAEDYVPGGRITVIPDGVAVIVQ